MDASCNGHHARWFVPGLWPKLKMASMIEISSVTVPCQADGFGSPPKFSWHMLLQSEIVCAVGANEAE